MTILAGLHHLTHYRYDRPVTLGPQIIRLRPAPHSRTRVLSHSIKVSPGGHFVNHQQDVYGNWQARYVFPEPVTEFRIEVDLVADMTVYNPFDFFVEEEATTYPFHYPADIRDDLAVYRAVEPASPALAKFLADLPREAPSTVNFVVDLNRRVSEAVRYTIRMEPGVMTPEETLTQALGSCRDSSWLLVNVLRHLGFAARFVSGYLIQLKPDLKALDGPQGTEVDFTDLHAWAEVYLPGAGWIGLDPTSGLLAGESHIPLAATRITAMLPPLPAWRALPEVDFQFEMKVTRFAERPRITRPFSDDAWAALDRLGEKVDAVLAAQDVRLTMGGEPTFISIDDFQSGEWNTDAVGPTKRDLADQLIRRLRDKFAPAGFLHYGQGKWYPGESLPRWTFSLYWRRDGKPIWQNAALIATEAPRADATVENANRLLGDVARAMGLPDLYVQPLYEDPAVWVMQEANLPDNVTRMIPSWMIRRSGRASPGCSSAGWAAGRLCPARTAPAGFGAGLAQRIVEDPARQADAGARRQPGRVPAAAQGAAACAGSGLSLYLCGRPHRRSWRTAGFHRPAAGRRSRTGLCDGGERCFRHPAGRAIAAERRPCRPDCHIRGSSRRAALRVHAAGRAGRGLSRIAGDD